MGFLNNLFGNNCGGCGMGDDSSILFFFLLLIILFGNCGIGGEDSSSLLFFFLLLVVLFCSGCFGCGGEGNAIPDPCGC